MFNYLESGMVIIPYDKLEILVQQAVLKVLNSDGYSQSTIDKEIYFNVDEAAEFLSKTPNALRVMVCKRQISCMKKQNKLYFKKSDMIEYLESGRIKYIEKNAVDFLTKKVN